MHNNPVSDSMKMYEFRNSIIPIVKLALSLRKYSSFAHFRFTCNYYSMHLYVHKKCSCSTNMAETNFFFEENVESLSVHIFTLGKYLIYYVRKFGKRMGMVWLLSSKIKIDRSTGHPAR